MNKLRQYLQPDEIEKIEYELRQSNKFFITGTNSLYVPEYQTSFIDVTACKEWPNMDGEVILMTPGEAARQEMNRYLDFPKLWARRKDFSYLDIAPPQFYNGVKYHGDLWYFDLQGAYHQLYKYMSLDMKWPRGQGDLLLYDVANRLADWKTARNSVVGISRVHTIVYNKGKEVWDRPIRNNLFNPHLWFHVQATLHEIATTAIYFGAKYIGTDCYIFNRLRGANNFRDYLFTSRLLWREIQGDGYIKGWASYKVGSKKTMVDNDTGMLSNIQEFKGMIEWRLKMRKHLD